MFLILVDNLVLEDWNERYGHLRSVNDQGVLVVQLRPSLSSLLELKIINCPKLQALPVHFGPQKLEISGCQLLSTLLIPDYSRRLQRLALDTCHDGTLVRVIPETISLYSLVISNISSLTSLPKWPTLSGLNALYIHNCEALVSLSEEEASFQGLTSLKLLSIWGCPKLVTLPNKGLPASLERLSIGSCPSLKSLGPGEMLKSLTSLRDLYIEDCPAVETLPEKGFSSSLKHLHVEGCPILTRRCQKDIGPDWSKIKDIPDLDLEPIEVSSVPNLLKEQLKPTWYHHFTLCKGIDIKEIGQPLQRNPVTLVQRERGELQDLKNSMYL
ncbi:uncharacterized protein LOC132298632 [Cornus florida]|uniref:uncharacterized protein LOC132298632 n=1 Tax=Cornus florida TaxID=4283 RepID=UPI0028A2CFEF|nr:uncharacterized protein LOC132298632 [Cornus florida]